MDFVFPCLLDVLLKFAAPKKFVLQLKAREKKSFKVKQIAVLTVSLCFAVASKFRYDVQDHNKNSTKK